MICMPFPWFYKARKTLTSDLSPKFQSKIFIFIFLVRRFIYYKPKIFEFKRPDIELGSAVNGNTHSQQQMH